MLCIIFSFMLNWDLKTFYLNSSLLLWYIELTIFLVIFMKCRSFNKSFIINLPTIRLRKKILTKINLIELFMYNRFTWLDFYNFRRLRCNRNYIHLNLFFAFFFRAIFHYPVNFQPTQVYPYLHILRLIENFRNQFVGFYESSIITLLKPASSLYSQKQYICIIWFFIIHLILPKLILRYTLPSVGVSIFLLI